MVRTQYVSNMEGIKDETSENLKWGEQSGQDSRFCSLRQNIR